MENLSSEQIVMIGLIASVLVSVLKYVNAYLSKSSAKMDKRTLAGIVYVVSFGLTFWLNPEVIPNLPVFPSDVAVQEYATVTLKWLADLLNVGIGQFGFATLIYMFVGKKVEEQLGEEFVGN